LQACPVCIYIGQAVHQMIHDGAFAQCGKHLLPNMATLPTGVGNFAYC